MRFLFSWAKQKKNKKQNKKQQTNKQKTSLFSKSRMTFIGIVNLVHTVLN